VTRFAACFILFCSFLQFAVAEESVPPAGQPTVKEMAEQLRHLAASGGLVTEPKAPADFYHNARILSQRGEVDLAMASYEQLFKFPITFADPVQDLIILARRTYGTGGAREYLETKLKPVLSNDNYLFAAQLAQEELLPELERQINEDKISYPPAMAAFLVAAKKTLSQHRLHWMSRRAVVRSMSLVTAAYNEGRFTTFFLDQLRADQLANDAMSITGAWAYGEWDFAFPVKWRYAGHLAILKSNLARMKGKDTGATDSIDNLGPPAWVMFKDKLDFKKPATICYSTRDDKNHCVELTGIIKKLNEGLDVNVGDRADLQWNVAKDQFLCITRLTYVDERGVLVDLGSADLYWQFDPSNYTRPNFVVSNATIPRTSPEQYGEFLDACLKTDSNLTKEVVPATSAAKVLANPQNETGIPKSLVNTVQPLPLSVSKSSLLRRVALVLGNSKYRSQAPLSNPKNDVNLIATSLKQAGFQTVTVKTDLNREQVLKTIHEFASLVDNSDWAVVYYSGHGIEFNGTNYIIPVDAMLKTDRDVDLEAIDVDKVLTSLEGARKLRLLILDSCRSNPFIATMKRTVATRSVGRGLAPIEPEAGTLVVYSAKHGQEALDGDGSDSPFATALAKRMQVPNLDVRRLFDLVRDDVMAVTNKAQQPFTYGSLSGSEDFYFVQK
jgi:hypothetical protein